MDWYAFLMGSIPLLIQLYADKYRNEDLKSTLTELQDDLNLVKPKIYDFVIGECHWNLRKK